MTIILKKGLCEGEIISRLPEHTHSHWRHPGCHHLRYVDSGVTAPATGYRIFDYSPLRRRKTR
jgi:hypothetical protein